MCYLVWETVRQTDGQADRHAEELRAKWHCHSLWVSLPERERGGQGHTKDRQADIQTDRQADDKRQQAVERKERLNQKRQWAWVRGMNDRQWEGEKEEEGRKMCHPPPALSSAVLYFPDYSPAASDWCTQSAACQFGSLTNQSQLVWVIWQIFPTLFWSCSTFVLFSHSAPRLTFTQGEFTGQDRLPIMPVNLEEPHKNNPRDVIKVIWAYAAFQTTWTFWTRKVQ